MPIRSGPKSRRARTIRPRCSASRHRRHLACPAARHRVDRFEWTGALAPACPAGLHYSDPEFSWKFAVPPAGIGFLSSSALGPQYRNDLFAGAATPNTSGGYLFRFNLTGNRRKIGVDDPRLEDRVADNNAKNDITESESLLFGTDFGVGTDIETGPNGNLFVVSLSNGAVYEIFRK